MTDSTFPSVSQLAKASAQLGVYGYVGIMAPHQLQTVLEHNGQSHLNGCFVFSERMNDFMVAQRKRRDALYALGQKAQGDAIVILADELQEQFMQSATQVFKAQEDSEKEELRSRNESLAARLAEAERRLAEAEAATASQGKGKRKGKGKAREPAQEASGSAVEGGEGDDPMDEYEPILDTDPEEETEVTEEQQTQAGTQ